MKTIYRDFITAPRARLAALALASTLALVACGGGGGSAGTTGAAAGTGTSTTTPVATAGVTLSFVNANGVASNALSAATPLTARATVKDATGTAVAGAVVAFATDATLGLFTPAAGTSLTDTTGVATITLRPATLAASGAGTLTATATVAGATVTSSANYTIGGTALTFGTLTSTVASIAAYGTTTLSVDVLANGAKYTAQAVTLAFSSPCVAAGKATLASSVATNGGTAQAVYRDNGCGNNDTITVTADSVTGSASTTLAIARPAAASVQFTSVAPVGKSIVIAGQGGIGRTETATLTFTVIDIFGNPLAGQVVNFASSTSLVTLNKTTDTTDALGQVTTTVNSGSTATVFSILASLPVVPPATTVISTRSDSITVTTGLPDQAHLSLSATVFNTDGLNYDSGTTTPASNINVGLADKNGNPVADGVSIVFATNLGAVGSSSQGACTTLNGGCSVDFRTQAPRTATPGLPATPCNTGSGTDVGPDSTRVGLATVCASVTDGTTTLFSRIGIFFGGTTATAVLNSNTAVPANTGTPYDLGSIVRTNSKLFTLQINDVNGNPMPLGTTVALDGLGVQATGTATPAIVPNLAPVSASGSITGANVTGNQGSTHTITIVPTQTAASTACVAGTITFNVLVVASPSSTHAVTTTFPFKLAVTCS